MTLVNGTLSYEGGLSPELTEERATSGADPVEGERLSDPDGLSDPEKLSCFVGRDSEAGWLFARVTLGS
jgi:hypothetical protein